MYVLYSSCNHCFIYIVSILTDNQHQWHQHLHQYDFYMPVLSEVLFFHTYWEELQFADQFWSILCHVRERHIHRHYSKRNIIFISCWSNNEESTLNNQSFIKIFHLRWSSIIQSRIYVNKSCIYNAFIFAKWLQIGKTFDKLFFSFLSIQMETSNERKLLPTTETRYNSKQYQCIFWKIRNEV